MSLNSPFWDGPVVKGQGPRRLKPRRVDGNARRVPLDSLDRVFETLPAPPSAPMPSSVPQLTPQLTLSPAKL